MPLLELATVRLHPQHTPTALPSGFTPSWSRAVELATQAASGIPFQLYHSTTSPSVYYLVGGWHSGSEHIAFLSTPDAVALAKSIGEYMTVDIVQHVDGDVSRLGERQRPSRLKVSVYKVPLASEQAWESTFASNHVAGAGGWDVSAEVQQQHKAFRQMGEVTNSVQAFGGSKEGGKRTWVWIQDAEGSSEGEEVENDVEAEVFEMEYVLG